MDATEAEAELKDMVAWNVTPALSQTQIDRLVAQMKRPDPAGRVPSDPDWEPTWALNWAAKTGWRWKAGLAASMYNVATQGKNLQRGSVYGNCMAQAAMYRRLEGVLSVPLTSRYQGSNEVPR